MKELKVGEQEVDIKLKVTINPFDYIFILLITLAHFDNTIAQIIAVTNVETIS